MFTYEPLREYLGANGQTIKSLMRDVGFTTNVAVALNNDKPVRIDTLAEICIYLNLSIGEVVEVKDA